MPQYQVGQQVIYQGKPHRITALDNGEAELEPIDGPSEPERGGPPSPSVMDERGMLDKAVDFLPAALSTAGSLVGGSRKTIPGMALAGLGAAGGEGMRQTVRSLQGRPEQVPDTAGGQVARMAEAGAVGAGVEGGGRGIVAGLGRFAPAAMDAALGAQKVVRRNYPTVDLKRVALSKGGGLATPFPAKDITARTMAAHAAVPASGAAADAGGARAIDVMDVIGDLKALRDRFEAARKPDAVQAIDDYIQEVSKQYGPQGMSIKDALIRKAEVQAEAKGTLQGAADPRAASLRKRAANAEQRGLTRTLHDESRAPGVGPALTHSQEMKALETAVKNIPQPSIGGPAGALVYGARKTLLSPNMLGRYGIAADRMSAGAGFWPKVRGGVDAMTRLALMELLEQAGQK
ncbi:MAG: hypothetical protein Q8R78_04790 [Candidatus Omnitrophota bacterium]|nr:hypothetical protein [Candidatus Omnitrophota bacterium]